MSGKHEAFPVSTERRFAHGYWMVKVAKGKWRFKHHLVAEEKLGRPLALNERVYFKDRNKENFDPDNIYVTEVGGERNVNRSRKTLEAQEKLLLWRINELSEALVKIQKQLTALNATYKPIDQNPRETYAR